MCCGHGMGLCGTDDEWVQHLEEICQWKMPAKVRASFAIILQYCHPSQPRKLYDKFKDEMADDILHRERTHCNHGNTQPNMLAVYNEVLMDIDENLAQMGSSLDDFKDMPQLDQNIQDLREAKVIREEQYDLETQAEKAQQMKPLLNESQTHCFDLITGTTLESRQNSFVIDSPGGYGKTFLFATLAAHFRSKGEIVLIVASTGLAAQNLEGGRTAHSRFKIPIDIRELFLSRFRQMYFLEKHLIYLVFKWN